MIENIDLVINNLPSGNTLSDSLKRIKLLRNILSALGFSLGLKAGETALTNSSISDPDADKVSTLEQVVKAFNTIVLNNLPVVEAKTSTSEVCNFTLNKGEKLTIPAGYYKTGFNIGGFEYSGEISEQVEALKEEIQAQLAGLTAGLVVPGYKIPVITEKADGTLAISYEEGTLGSIDNPVSAGTKDASDKLIITTKAGDSLTSDIPYHTGGEVEVKIDVKEGAIDENSEKVTVNEINVLPKGYYDNLISIIPVLNIGTEATNKAINVEASKIINVNTLEYTLEPGDGFDYIKNGTIKVQEGTASIAVATEGNKVTITPSVTDGWIDSINSTGTNVTTDKNGNYVVTIPTITSDDAQAELIYTHTEGEGTEGGSDKFTIKLDEGYYDGNNIPVTYDGKEIAPFTNTSITINNATDKEESDGTYTIPVIPANTPTLVKSPLNIEVNKSSMVLGNSGTQTTETAISSKTVYISTEEGYTEGEEKKLVVTSASEPTLEVIDNGTNIAIKIDTAGWIDETSKVVTTDFIEIADQLIDTTGGTTGTPESTDGLVEFDTNSIKDAQNGTLVKIPSDNTRYFTSAKIDLSELLTEMNNI